MQRVGHGVDYSTWNPRTLRWDYWRTLGGAKLRAGVIAPAPRLSHRQLGVAPEQAARKLPSGARKVGTGDVARGQVASHQAMGIDDDARNLLLFAGAAYLMYRFVWRSR